MCNVKLDIHVCSCTAETCPLAKLDLPDKPFDGHVIGQMTYQNEWELCDEWLKLKDGESPNDKLNANVAPSNCPNKKTTYNYMQFTLCSTCEQYCNSEESDASTPRA